MEIVNLYGMLEMFLLCFALYIMSRKFLGFSVLNLSNWIFGEVFLKFKFVIGMDKFVFFFIILVLNEYDFGIRFLYKFSWRMNILILEDNCDIFVLYFYIVIYLEIFIGFV